ncbi:CoA ester lyase [Mesobaculum littorinae]|uniref:CoA ester lyase n=1 Tax=Mesobaculum littorinae TaxID=2486419 RepID=A0A438AD56_9RHOB|nr:CoA ester lyase [Mesobaculum littorinae]RVV96636.1 CoA ester lyase [Mesobaculum littorinae]
MDITARPWRSALYIPASRARALDKARSLPVDAILFDLEDAVAPSEKDAARITLREALAQGGYGARSRIVRVNGAATPWGAADLEAVTDMAPDAVLVPKVSHAHEITRIADRLAAAPGCAETGIWAMIETPGGVLNAPDIAAAPRMQALVMGTNDLGKELGCRGRPDRLPLMASLQACLLAARAAGILCLDGVYNAFRDEDGLRAECEQGRDLGMDGKTVIHPGQIAIANVVFAPTGAEIDLARRQIAAYEAAAAQGQGIAVLDGRIVEGLHVATARATLAKAAAIASRGTE